jgi:hypothetical protein
MSRRGVDAKSTRTAKFCAATPLLRPVPHTILPDKATGGEQRLSVFQRSACVMCKTVSWSPFSCMRGWNGRCAVPVSSRACVAGTAGVLCSCHLVSLSWIQIRTDFTPKCMMLDTLRLEMSVLGVTLACAPSCSRVVLCFPASLWYGHVMARCCEVPCN